MTGDQQRALNELVMSAICRELMIVAATGKAEPAELAAIAVAAGTTVAALLTSDADTINNLSHCLVVRAGVHGAAAAVERASATALRVRAREEKVGAEVLKGRVRGGA